ncbi:hypothetical protein [Larsenimonas rhizosphaerae]|uniref:Uncharacterized protein n=1 Tax=Larsenimonas rhizosphaerae TaxID=2944682 RepID=A0AA41ZMF5_9GAMM|nr:hypothetical protein [Larsenimonas rhizosphaerae]MCX2524906.1 hypothetical protein [Larsenimonas rhizosphaerae]
MRQIVISRRISRHLRALLHIPACHPGGEDAGDLRGRDQKRPIVVDQRSELRDQRFIGAGGNGAAAEVTASGFGGQTRLRALITGTG